MLSVVAVVAGVAVVVAVVVVAAVAPAVVVPENCPSFDVHCFPATTVLGH